MFLFQTAWETARTQSAAKTKTARAIRSDQKMEIIGKVKVCLKKIRKSKCCLRWDQIAFITEKWKVLIEKALASFWTTWRTCYPGFIWYHQNIAEKFWTIFLTHISKTSLMLMTLQNSPTLSPILNVWLCTCDKQSQQPSHHHHHHHHWCHRVHPGFAPRYHHRSHCLPHLKHDFAVVLHGSQPNQHLASKTTSSAHGVFLPKGLAEQSVTDENSDELSSSSL